MLEQLIHNGVIVPEPPEAPGLSLVVRGQRLEPDAAQEEMAMAWAAKKDTDYVQDPEFVENFLGDFSAALGITPVLELKEVDFQAYYGLVDEQRRLKQELSKEERKAQAAERKRVREELKARYGYAIVNGQRVELGTYMVEPSGIFMGRGQHPLRGRWKQGARQSDITLNYGPGPSTLGDRWKEVVWQPESLWVARWEDRLTGKLKYIWLSDTAPVKQSREAEKFDQALKLDKHLRKVRKAIREGLNSEDRQDRMVAAACYLIDELCLRVGDEKGEDEADTVGATTLRPEHITLHDDGTAEFEFLGKDSVAWHKTLALSTDAYDALEQLIQDARPSRAGDGGAANPASLLPQLFPDIDSGHVNRFLSRALPGLSAKKFRTYHATKAVERSLDSARVSAGDADYKKWRAANVANLEAAQLCNHTKQTRGTWEDARVRWDERIERAQARVRRYAAQVKDAVATHADLMNEAEEREAAADETKRESVQERYTKRLATAARRVETARERHGRSQLALGKIRAQKEIAQRKREWNTSTSLKSYVDPRVYQRWGEKVDYDVLNAFYPTALRRKYAWVQYVDAERPQEADPIRPCLPRDAEAVAAFLGEMVDLPIEAAEVRGRYLPDLAEDWRVALVAEGEGGRITAFASLGPAYEGGDAPLLDCYAVVRNIGSSDALVAALTTELSRQFERFVLDHPVGRGRPGYRLQPRDTGWYDYAPGLARSLGLEADDGADDSADDDD